MSLFADARRAVREAALVVAVDAATDIAVIHECEVKMMTAVGEVESLKRACSEKVAELQGRLSMEREALAKMVVPETQQKLEELKQRNAEVQQRIADVLSQVKDRENRLKDLTNKEFLLLQEKKDLGPSHGGLRCTVDLYRATTRVQFNLQTEPHIVEGFIAEPENVAPFELSTNENSQFFVVNHIWSLMAPSEN
jgi:cell division protein FtsB